jgi:hypothetical protein
LLKRKCIITSENSNKPKYNISLTKHMQIKHGEENLMDTYNEISLAMLIVLTCGSFKIMEVLH